MQPDDRIAILDLGRLRSIELKDKVPSEYFVTEEPGGAAGRSNELATTILVFSLAAPIVVGIAGWLLAGVTKDTVQFSYEKRGADGSRERASFSHKVSKRDAADPAFVAKLGEIIAQTLRLGSAPAG